MMSCSESINTVESEHNDVISVFTEASDVSFANTDFPFEDIYSFIKERDTGDLAQVNIMKSEIRDGYYIVADYSWRDKTIFYYEKGVGIVDIGIGGHRNTFSLREVSISQGDFLEVFEAGSMGLGVMRLYKNDEIPELVFSTERDSAVIDFQFDYRSIAEASSLLSSELLAELSEGDYISWVFANGRMDAEYDDVNSDGHTDIRFYGIRKTVLTKNNYDAEQKTIIAEDLWTVIYLFDPALNEFIHMKEERIPLKMTT